MHVGFSGSSVPVLKREALLAPISRHAMQPRFEPRVVVVQLRFAQHRTQQPPELIDVLVNLTSDPTPDPSDIRRLRSAARPLDELKSSSIVLNFSSIVLVSGS
jgi:hypothetical protein